MSLAGFFSPSCSPGQHSPLAYSASAFTLKGAFLSLQQEFVSVILGSCHSWNSLLKLPRNELCHWDTVIVMQGTKLKPSKQVSQKCKFRMLFTSGSTEPLPRETGATSLDTAPAHGSVSHSHLFISLGNTLSLKSKSGN